MHGTRAGDSDKPRLRSARPLSAPEQDAWIGLLRIVLQLPATLDARLRRESGLVLNEYIVLSVLAESENRSRRMSVIAGEAHLSPSRLSHLMTRLEERGLVVRGPSADDGRVILATLTADGVAAVRAVGPQHVRDIRELVLDRLSSDQVLQLGAIAAAIASEQTEEARS